MLRHFVNLPVYGLKVLEWMTTKWLTNRPVFVGVYPILNQMRSNVMFACREDSSVFVKKLLHLVSLLFGQFFRQVVRHVCYDLGL